MGNRTGLQLNSKQSLHSQLAMLIGICNCWIEDKKPALYYRLLSLCDFLCANVVIMLALSTNFQSRQMGALVAVISSLAITTTTVGIREILRARANDGTGPGTQIATIGMLVFPFVLPVFVKYSSVFVWVAYILVMASFVILVGESILARRVPLPSTIIPSLLAIALAPVLIIGSSISQSVSFVMVVTLFYAVFVMVVFSVLSAGKVLRVVRVEG